MSRPTGHLPLRQHCHIHLPLGITRILALLLLIPSVAHAATPGDAQTYLLSAKRLFQAFDYEGALTQIQLAREVPRSREQEITLLLYEGIMLAELTRWEESTAAFRNALALSPEVPLPMKVSPKVKERFESLREQEHQELATQVAPAPASDSPLEKPDPPVESTSKTTLVPLPSPPSLTIPSPSPSEHSPSYFLVPAIAGGSLVAAGGISWALSRGELNRLRTAAPSLMSENDVRHSVSRGRTLQTLGMTLLGVGSAGLLTAAGWYVFGGSTDPLTLGAGPDGSAAFIYGGLR